MILISKEKHKAVFTVDSETKVIYTAPIQDDGTVNLSELKLLIGLIISH